MAYAPHEQRVVDEKRDLDEKREKLRAFIEGRGKFEQLDTEDQILLRNQFGAMNVYSAVLAQRIARFTANDFPLGKACDLSGDGSCEACQ